MSAEEVRIQPDAGNPVGDQSSVLPGCQTPTQRMSTGEQELARLFTDGLEIVVDCLAGLLGQFEPHGLPSLLLADCRPIDCIPAGRNVLDLERRDITTAQLAVDG